MVFNLFKRKEVPEELPDLATDTLVKNSEIKKDEKIVNKYLKEKEAPTLYKKEVSEVTPQKNKEVSEAINEESEEPEESFFNKLQEDINTEISNLNKLESWYNNKFLPQDIVTEMRNHWEKQKSSDPISFIGRNFREKIKQRTAKLQELEREWQSTYFQLVEKEEELRKEEHELKKLLAEFVDLCRARKKKRKK
jgi:hypothetical protein